jgi:carbon monoxide dehydrogenase subunit G
VALRSDPGERGEQAGRASVILNHEFTVEGDLDTVWRALLDLERVAGCLPGATIRATGEEGRFEGSMKLKIGPMTVSYDGTATLVDANDEQHRAVISLRAREAKGQGTALATITNHVQAVGGSVHVRAETDLQVTGPQARFGRGVMEDVGNRVLGEFAQRLQHELAGDAAPTTANAGGTLPPVADAFDMGAAFAQTSAARSARRLAPLVIATLAVLLFWRPRRGVGS